MNAAKILHASIHANTVAWLVYNKKHYKWLVDLDIHVEHDDNVYILRPDIVGKYKKTGEYKIFIEISHSTLKKDLNHKLNVYAAQNIEYYIVVDCTNKIIKQFKNIGKDFVDHTIFPDMDEIFQLQNNDDLEYEK